MENPVTHKNLAGYKVKGIAAFTLLIVLIICSVALLYLKIQEGATINARNQGYVRYIACTIDIRVEQKVNTVSDEISDACWEQAEHEIGESLPRYSEKTLLDK